ncbi:MAG: cobalamin-dependent protein [Desulfomonile sp.]|nr:cobalamin-dependent protein [Desulfomonile sp.]
MRVLLIYSNQRRDLFAAPPIGLCSVAGAAASAGHEVRVLDLCFRNRVRSNIEEAISKFSPGVVGISIRNIDNLNLLYPVNYLSETREIVDVVRTATNAPIVLGGAGASLMPAEILEYHRADFIVVSDGEVSFVQLLAALDRGVNPQPIPGVGMMRNGRPSLVPPTFAQPFTYGSHVGRWVDLAPYRRLGSSYPIQTKRGCTHSCIYCLYSSRLEGTRLRLRPPADVVEEMDEAVRRYRVSSFEFVDSVFNEPTDHCVELLEEVIRRPWKVTLAATSLTPGNLDPNMLDLMWRTGFRSFSMSPESAHAGDTGFPVGYRAERRLRA